MSIDRFAKECRLPPVPQREVGMARGSNTWMLERELDDVRTELEAAAAEIERLMARLVESAFLAGVEHVAGPDGCGAREGEAAREYAARSSVPHPDTVRLDWLETHTFALDNDAERMGPREMPKLYVGERALSTPLTAHNVRAIIDAARAARSQEARP